MRTLSKTGIAVCAVLAMLLIGLVTAASAAKPQAPVRLVISPLQQIGGPQAVKPGDTLSLIISATAFLEIDEMLIETFLVGGAEYIAGDRRWQGSVQPGERREIRLTVRRPLQGAGKVKARVTLSRGGKVLLTKQALYDLDGKKDGGAAKPSQPSRKDAKGRAVAEQ